MNATAWLTAALTLLVGSGGAGAVDPQDLPFDHTHAAWTRVLEQCVRGDRFDYRALSESRGPLDEYLLQLRGVQAGDFATWTREQRCAFWINAYNAFAVHLVLSRYPLDSIQDIGTDSASAWEQQFLPLAHLSGGLEAEKVALNAVQDEVLRAQFEDARVLVALHRVSESSPPLRAAAFQAEELERQLDAQVRAWLADPRFNRFERDKGRMRVSALFDWFEGDFVRDAGSVRAWIARHAPAREAAWLRESQPVEVDHLAWSWRLNDIEREEH